MPVVFHPDYVAPMPPGHRFPMDKFRRYVEHLTAEGLVQPDDLVIPAEAPAGILALIHDPAYVMAVNECRVAEDIVRRIGFPITPATSRRARLAVGGTMLAASLARDHGIAFNAAGGSHHAFPHQGGGFCVFNDLAVTATWLLREGMARRVLVIDLDVHQGDGTAVALAGNASAFTFSMHCGVNYPVRKQQSDLDIALETGTGDDLYLEHLSGVLPELFSGFDPDFVLYVPGVDVHGHDRLGRLELTDAGLAARDRMVLEYCFGAGCPVAVVMGGGYDPLPDVLAARHATTARVAHDMLGHARDRRDG